jgi:hypothetical protein
MKKFGAVAELHQKTGSKPYLSCPIRSRAFVDDFPHVLFRMAASLERYNGS